MTAPPIGWATHDFWHNLHLEISAHQESLAVAALFLLMLVIGRALLPPADRVRLRLSLVTLIFFFLALPARAGLLTFGLETAYAGLKLAAVIALAWGIIGVGGLIIFDLIGRRFGMPKIFRDVIVSVVSAVAMVLVLSRSGVNFLSIVTTSAVLTAVIGLALQDTIGNLFSGIAMQLEAPFSIGDWIRVDERSIGRVLEIRWRSTLIQTKNDDLVVIPNAILTKGVVTIFNKDGLENRRWVYFNVHLRHAPNLVQKVVTEALQGTPNVSTKKPADCITWRYHESWLEYAVRYRLVDYLPDDPTDSEVRKRIWYALHRNHIEMPYPGFNLFLTQLDAERAANKSEKDMQRRLHAIDGVSFFAPLAPPEREQAADGLVHRVYGAGEVLIRAGAEAHDLYILASGDAAVKIGVNGLEKELAALKGGDFFGEMSLMTGAPRSATVVAKSDVDCYVLNKAIFKQLLEKNPSLLGQVGKLFSEREVNLKMERDGLSAAAARQHVEKQDLVARIKDFFGID
jgi:small-conductance mechanosensitive channel/CRP-like cAMP-binding protein